MTKEEFYNQRKESVLSDYEEFRKKHPCRKSTQLVAEKNNISYSLTNAIIYQKDYNQKPTKTTT